MKVLLKSKMLLDTAFIINLTLWLKALKITYPYVLVRFAKGLGHVFRLSFPVLLGQRQVLGNILM